MRSTDDRHDICLACRGHGWKFHRSRRAWTVGTLSRGQAGANCQSSSTAGSRQSGNFCRGSGPEISGPLRRLAAMILSRDTSCKSSLRGKRLQAGWNNDVLAGILTGFSGN